MEDSGEKLCNTYYLAPLIIENLVLRNVLKILKTQVLSDYKHQ